MKKLELNKQYILLVSTPEQDFTELMNFTYTTAIASVTDTFFDTMLKVVREGGMLDRRIILLDADTLEHIITIDTDAIEAHRYYIDRRISNKQVYFNSLGTKLFKEVAASGGATVVDGKIVKYEDGYQVAIGKENEHSFPAKYLYIELPKYAYQNDTFGVWIDGDTCYVDLTPTRHIDNRDIAMLLAKENDQKAIYNWRTGESEAV